MRFELTRVGLLVELANHYTPRGALERECVSVCVCVLLLIFRDHISVLVD